MSPLLLHSNKNQYNINGLFCTYTEMFRIQTCCNAFYQLQRGFGGRRHHARIQEFLLVYLVLSLFYSLQRGSNGFIAQKTILILYQGSRVDPLFSGGGGSSFFPGGGGGVVQMLISIETHIRTCYFPGGGGCPDPISPSGSAHGQCHHNGTIFITVWLLTIIVRHWFVRINDRWGFPNDSLMLRTFDTFEKHSSCKW